MEIDWRRLIPSFEKGWDPGQERLAEEERKSLIARFPLDKWPTMTLEEYAEGTGSKDTFCNWMEFKTVTIGGIGGGFAKKFLIFMKQKNEPGPSWSFPKKNNYPDEQAAWNAIRAGFMAAFELASKGEFDRIDEIDAIRSAHMVRCKAVFVYFPDELFPIFSHSHIKHYLRMFGEPEDAIKQRGVVGNNRRLCQLLRRQPEFNGWDKKKIQLFLYQDDLRVPSSPDETIPSPPFPPKGEGKTMEMMERFARDLESKGQIILYGPPGTGKTFHALRFAVWWLRRQLGVKDPEAVLADAKAFRSARDALSYSPVARRTWWIVANPKEWSWNEMEKKEKFRYGRVKRNYPLLQPGDLVVGYGANPDKRIVALARVTQGLHLNENGEQKFEIEAIDRVKESPSYSEMLLDPILANSEPMRHRCQGTLFALTEAESDHLLTMLAEKNPELQEHFSIETTGGHLTCLTFHASYSYEDFIEGFRPVGSGGRLSLQLRDGVFKRICREAQAHPEKPYLVLIDEINRANVAKVFGEIITLLEKDKRDQPVWLPQSGEWFVIPPNIHLIGTMNTADRSIKLLDAALRRRFAFIELMPDPGLLRGATIGSLDLEPFLRRLNRRIAEHEGREKQVGHSFLLDGDGPVTDPDVFAGRFRHEILPLLQEFCYDNYNDLARYLGSGLVDEKEQRVRPEILDDPDQLIEALAAAMPAEGQE